MVKVLASRPEWVVLVQTELQRQKALQLAGRFRFRAGENGDLHALAVLMEEVGEVARAINELEATQDMAYLIEELVQVAAVCCCWLTLLNTAPKGAE